MKKEIHPDYKSDAKVDCACGNSFAVGSTIEKIEVELCSACHPFYTGKQKLVDTARRVEKFKARATKTSADKVKSKKEKEAKRADVKKIKREQATPGK